MDNLCDVCHLVPFKYRCPACDVKSCSLICVRRHKLETQCSGQVDPTKYIKKDEISAVDVNRDYNFFLNMNRKIAIGKADAKQTKPLALNTLKRPYNGPPSGPHNVKRVFTNTFDNTNVSIKRGVNVKFVPKGMSRSNINKTGYDKKKNCFNWTIEWLLIDGEINKIQHKFISYKCKESSKLAECFPKKNFIKFLQSSKNAEVKEEVEPLNEATQDETDVSVVLSVEEPEFHFYIKNFSNSVNRRIIRLDSEKLIADLLRGKTVLEFPTIYVSLDPEVKGMIVVDDGVESDSDSSDSSSSDSSDSDSESSSEDESSADELEIGEAGLEKEPEQNILEKKNEVEDKDQDETENGEENKEDNEEENEEENEEDDDEAPEEVSAKQTTADVAEKDPISS